MQHNIVFYVAYPYYFPHFLPISKAFEDQNYHVKYILSDKQNTELMVSIANHENLEYVIGEKNLFEIDMDVVFFANVYDRAKELNVKTVFLCHGIGTKQCGFDLAFDVYDIVLVEGNYRFEKFNKMFQAKQNKIKKVGYSKLDTVFEMTNEDKDKILEKHGLDNKKKTILYAPTFFPSSIEKMSHNFPEDFKNFNIIVKPHYLSLERKRYKNQQKKFVKWAKYENCSICTVDEYNLVPFLAIADIMISDESSAIFEFTALDKPVILNRFLKLRWSYYLNPKKILSRMDRSIDTYRNIGDNAKDYQEMVAMVKNNIVKKDKYKGKREAYTVDICGEVDGEVSERIVQIIKETLEI